MINLLPPDIKQGYSYALRNITLVRWIIAFVLGIAGLAVLAGAGWMYMNQQITSYRTAAAATQSTLDAEHLTEIESQVKEISSNFKLVVQVLSQEVLFSQLLKQIATLMPPGANLTNLNISSTEGAVVISAETVNYASATQLQINLQDPNNKIFAEADTQTINCDTNGDASRSAYPCTITINALFAKNTPFLFINQGGKP